MAKPFSKTVIHNTDAKLSKQVRQPLKTNQGIHKALTWRVVDIAVGAAVGVMSGVMFWVFDGLSYGLFPLMTLILPGSAALLHALFYFPATLGSLIVRKPGASAYVLLVASFVEVVLGTKYSVSLVVIALLQAAAAEAVFALFRYRRWTLGVTILSALASSTTSTCCSSTIRHSRSSAREASSALFASCLARWHSPVSVPGECIALYVSQVFCRDSLPRIRNITKKTPESTFGSMPRPF